MSEPHWSETDSQTFAQYSSYFIPKRNEQIDAIVATLAGLPANFSALELGCGDGTLAHAILERFAAATVYGLDGSPHMLETARARLKSYAGRFVPEPFELAGSTWRRRSSPVHAVVSSLVIHHLDGPAKQALFRDVFALLEPGGAFTIADVMRPASEAARQIAAHDWDEAARSQIAAANGPDRAYTRFVDDRWNMYHHLDQDPIDQPSTLVEQIDWLSAAGFHQVDCYWLFAGHAVFGGYR
ncbi:MAG: class I SAM-dependent methyltransferase [Gemmatimonadota bacterium]